MILSRRQDIGAQRIPLPAVLCLIDCDPADAPGMVDVIGGLGMIRTRRRPPS